MDQNHCLDSLHRNVVKFARYVFQIGSKNRQITLRLGNTASDKPIEIPSHVPVDLRDTTILALPTIFRLHNYSNYTGLVAEHLAGIHIIIGMLHCCSQRLYPIDNAKSFMLSPPINIIGEWSAGPHTIATSPAGNASLQSKFLGNIYR